MWVGEGVPIPTVPMESMLKLQPFLLVPAVGISELWTQVLSWGQLASQWHSQDHLHKKLPLPTATIELSISGPWKDLRASDFTAGKL